MLYFVTNNDDVHPWHVGTPMVDSFKARNITEVQADGDELMFIIRLFELNQGMTIPMAITARVMNWYGDIAKTIACYVIDASRRP